MISVYYKTDEIYDEICSRCSRAIGWVDEHNLQDGTTVNRYIDRAGSAVCEDLSGYPVTADMFHYPIQRKGLSSSYKFSVDSST